MSAAWSDIDLDGNLDVDEDKDGDLKLDCGEDLNCNGTLDGGEADVDGDGFGDAGIEEVFLARNPDSALKLGQARGVAIAAGVAHGLPVHEYAARKVKLGVVGTGRATKEQVQHMVRVLLQLPGEPQADAADALAIAICHVNTVGLDRYPPGGK